ncbi:MAG TPA: alpha/beta fold hydrolase [Ktedonobacteraceae bacterium]
MKTTGKLVTAGLAIGGALGTMALLNKLTISQAGELRTALKGEERRYPWKYGDIFYQVSGEREARPLLLIHSLAPGASAYEWRKNIDALAEQFRVYAIDLLGAGLSDRPAIDYTAETYTDLVGDFLKEVIGKPTTVVAHGLSSAFAIMCAYRRPQLFEKLIMVSAPISLLEERRDGLAGMVLKTVLNAPVVGEFIYNLLTSRRALRGYYDRQGYHNPGLVTDQMIEYMFSNAHQPESHYPAISLFSKELTTDIREPLARLRIPVIAFWGREAELAPNEVSAVYRQMNSHIETRIIDHSNQQLQDEQAGKFNALVRELAGTPVTQ